MRLLAFLLSALFSGCAGPRQALDDRIVGQWKSNRELTIPTIRYPTGAKPETIKKFEDIFGHIVVTYTSSTANAVMPAMNGFPEWRDDITYKIVERDSTSITMKFYDNTEKIFRTRKIVFEGSDRYWIDLEKIEGREYFDRIQK